MKFFLKIQMIKISRIQWKKVKYNISGQYNVYAASCKSRDYIFRKAHKIGAFLGVLQLVEVLCFIMDFFHLLDNSRM